MQVNVNKSSSTLNSLGIQLHHLYLFSLDLVHYLIVPPLIFYCICIKIYFKLVIFLYVYVIVLCVICCYTIVLCSYIFALCCIIHVVELCTYVVVCHISIVIIHVYVCNYNVGRQEILQQYFKSNIPIW